MAILLALNIFAAGASGDEGSLIRHRLIDMDPTRELGKVLLIGGVVMIAAGAFLLFGARLPLRLGRLPGDIAIQGRRGGFYFPIVTSLLLSVGLTLILWFVGWMRK